MIFAIAKSSPDTNKQIILEILMNASDRFLMIGLISYHDVIYALIDQYGWSLISSWYLISSR